MRWDDMRWWLQEKTPSPTNLHFSLRKISGSKHNYSLWGKKTVKSKRLMKSTRHKTSMGVLIGEHSQSLTPFLINYAFSFWISSEWVKLHWAFSLATEATTSIAFLAGLSVTSGPSSLIVIPTTHTKKRSCGTQQPRSISHSFSPSSRPLGKRAGLVLHEKLDMEGKHSTCYHELTELDCLIDCV